MFDSILARLTPNATLADLPHQDFQVEGDTLGQVVAAQFKAQPELPGVIVVEGAKILGVISQRKFFERMSQRFSLELYLKRPIQILPEIASAEAEPLMLPSDCSIGEAAQRALNRPLEFLYEPIVLILPDQQLRLVNITIVLLAQSQILTKVNIFIERQRREVQQSVQRLEIEQSRTKQYALQLEGKQQEILRANQMLERQQAELRSQAEQISHLNQRFIDISQLLSVEGKRAFQATFAGVNAICRNTDQVVQAGDLLERDLEVVDTATTLIENISRQVKHLALQAALIMNRSEGQMPGFDFIINEIGNLGTQSFKATNQVNEMASRFKMRIKELTNAAQAGEVTARSLIQKIQQAEIALSELEDLLSEQPLTSGQRSA